MSIVVKMNMDDRMRLFNKYLDRSKLEHKQYQYDGVRWILNNELSVKPVCNVRGGFIADEMGLGKTIMMIGTMVCNYLPRTLIVVPPVLIDQWTIQIYKTTGHKAVVYHGENKKNITLQDLNNATIVITTYGAVTMFKKQLEAHMLSMLHKVKWNRIIFDEAHHLRNMKTTRYISVKMLSSQIRWLVSGTPVQNRKQDFYSLCSILRMPASFYTNNENLPLLARSFILKRTKKGVGIVLPDVVADKNIVSWKNIREMQLAEEIHSTLEFSNVKSKDMNFPQGTLPLTQILRARQICIYPKLMAKVAAFNCYKDAFDHSSKLDYAVDTILKNMGNGCGKLIFCHFREEIDEIAQRLAAGGMTKVATFDSRTAISKRSDILNDKNEALILQIQTGCEGLNLQENYSEIYFISPHWNPAVEDQAIARCHRIGQTKSVFVQRFEMSNFFDEERDTVTVDSYICGVQDCKRIVADEYVNPPLRTK
jgi:SNF2 family DNA or RNA helicase